LVDAMSAPGVEIRAYPPQRLLVRNVSATTEKSGRQELIAMWPGQSANLAHHTKETELSETPVSDVSAMMNDTSAVRGKDAAL
jgi:nitronate monooxygenase